MQLVRPTLSQAKCLCTTCKNDETEDEVNLIYIFYIIPIKLDATTLIFVSTARVNPDARECPTERTEIIYESHMSSSRYPNEYVWDAAFKVFNMSEKDKLHFKEEHR